MKIIEESFGYWGKEFEAEYQKTTEPFDNVILHETYKILLAAPDLEKLEQLKEGFKY